MLTRSCSQVQLRSVCLSLSRQVLSLSVLSWVATAHLLYQTMLMSLKPLKFLHNVHTTTVAKFALLLEEFMFMKTSMMNSSKSTWLSLRHGIPTHHLLRELSVDLKYPRRKWSRFLAISKSVKKKELPLS